MLRSPNSASQMAKRKACPGSANAERGLPRIDTAWSDEGTLLHKHDANPDLDRSGLTTQQRGVLERNSGLREAFLALELPRLGIASDARREIIREREFILSDYEGSPIISHGMPCPAHPDIIYWYPDYLVAIIFDSKFGRIPVEAAWLNQQLKFYFVTFCDYYNPETVIVAITQPWQPKGNDFHSAEYSARNAPEFKQEIIDDIRATEPPDAPRRSSKDACRYCAANGVCPIAVNDMTELAILEIQNLTPAALVMLWDEMEKATNTIKAIKSRLQYLVETCPDAVPELELKSTGSVRSADALSVYNLLMEQAALPGSNTPEKVAFFMQTFSDFSVPAFQDWLQTAKGITAAKAKATVKDLLGDLLVENEKGKSLVRKVESVHQKKEAA